MLNSVSDRMVGVAESRFPLARGEFTPVSVAEKGTVTERLSRDVASWFPEATVLVVALDS